MLQKTCGSDDVMKGGLTASNLTVGMQRRFAEALAEIIEHNHWAKKNEDRVLVVKKSSDIELAKKDGQTRHHVRAPGQHVPRTKR